MSDEHLRIVVKSRRLLRTWFLPITIPAWITFLGVLAGTVAHFFGWIGLLIVSPVILAGATFLLWWMLRSCFVGMWISDASFISKGWIVDLQIDRWSIEKFESAAYGGNTVWWLAIEPPFGRWGDLTVVRVVRRDGTFTDVQSSFARPSLTARQVDQLNDWLTPT